MKYLYLIIISFILTACSNLDLSDISTGAVGTGAAAVASIVTSNPMIIAGATAGGSVAGGMLVVFCNSKLFPTYCRIRYWYYSCMDISRISWYA